MKRVPLAWALVPLPLGIVALLARLQHLRNLGYTSAARSLGLPGADALSALDRLSFLRSDLLLALLLLPAAALALAALLKPRYRPWVIGGLAVLALILLYVQLRAAATVGAYLHASLARSAIRFAAERPVMLSAYVSLGGLLKLFVLVVSTIALVVLAARLPAERLSRRSAAIAAAALVLVTSLAWLPTTNRAPAQQPLLTQAIGAFWHSSSGTAVAIHATPAELQAGFRRLTNTEPTRPDSAWFGKAAGSDVIVFVLETVPARCLDVDAGLDDLPTLRRLRQHALVGASHYSTYPASSQANFSLLSGWYPPELARPFVERHDGGSTPSLLHQLRRSGYHTAIYEPYQAKFENDPVMFRLLGAERHVAPGGRYDEKPGATRISQQDSAALRIAHEDLTGWLERRERYAMVFLLQSSHGPWADPVPGRSGATPLERCRALVAMEDAWLGRIVSLVERHGRLDSTLIVVTADHGVRTVAEYPSFVPGRLDAMSFHTPLLIFSPRAFRTTMVQQRVTSAIDVLPSVLDLLGVARERQLEHGAPVWDPQLLTRTTYFFADALLGVSGFHRDGAFSSWNDLAGLACRSPEMRCDATDIVPAGPGRDSIAARLDQARGITRAWLEQFTAAPAVD